MDGSPLDIDRLRADTIGCASGLIHLNNAGAALVTHRVADAVTDHLALEAVCGGYEAAELADGRSDAFYDAAATIVGGRRDEIAFTDSATRAWLSVFQALDWQEGDEVITASSEYSSHLITFRLAEMRQGVVTRIAPDTASGVVDPEGLEALITSRTRLICISHMPTNDGLLNPVEEIGKIAARHGVPFLLDACQSVGQVPMDVASLNCTMLSATGRKYLRGPRGTGFLWVRSDWIDRLTPAALDIRSARLLDVRHFEISGTARRFELWERYQAGQIGLGVACEYAVQIGLPAIWERIRNLAGYLRNELSEVPGISVFDRGAAQSGIVTFGHEALESKEIITRLRQEKRINTSLSATQLTRTELISRGVHQMVRASVHVYNTIDELDQLVAALRELSEPRGRRTGRAQGRRKDGQETTQPR